MVPIWRYKILEIIISKALVIDVELQDDAHLLPEIDFLSEEMPLLSDESNEASGEQPLSEAAQKRQKIRRVRDGMIKLDLIMEQLFIFMHTFVMEKDVVNEKNCREIFSFILNVFEKSMMPTFKSRYSHFLVFYLASLQSTLADQFLGVLFKPLVQFSQGLGKGRSPIPSPNLLFAVAYIGSFVARAKFLSFDLLQMAFEMLVDLSKNLLAKSTSGAPGVLQIMSLQHILYIFCARHQELVDHIGMDLVSNLFESLLQDPTLIYHCNTTVVEQFFCIAGEKLGLIDPESVFDVERNRHTRDQGRQSKFKDFGFYFPFDPLPLPNFKRFITDEIFATSIESDTESVFDCGSGRPSL